jgi:hypothetical protein
MDYVVLFDVATKPRAWLEFPWPLVLVMLTGFLILGELERDTDDGFLKRNRSRIIVAIVLIGLAWVVWSYETDRTRMIARLADGRVSVAEGEISNVTSRGGSKSGLAICFNVRTTKFCYHSSETTPVMNSCAMPIRPNLQVRVTYHDYNNRILRLEATKDSLDGVNAFLE